MLLFRQPVVFSSKHLLSRSWHTLCNFPGHQTQTPAKESKMKIKTNIKAGTNDRDWDGIGEKSDCTLQKTVTPEPLSDAA